jgi:hypothetical protein
MVKGLTVAAGAPVLVAVALGLLLYLLVRWLQSHSDSGPALWAA